ncbi:hypothetical protein GCM10009641_14230 [Mycobacterium cookii]|uniref:5,10-methylene-tetrahydrofolate dehydrogenase n=1 Tax=Mycobacterium cookii TaxID=1775 RepID=A0A7I7KYT9_9MYCO|nr:hypothetical protein [Mycobacterium cookii]MCV7330584.1 hypothetical protein [Mycobacterium cookii]BBX47225.1 hypothetical protein MCOO_32400 [Mycobacterium cookii]
MTTTTEAPRADTDPHIVLGLVGAPGTAFLLARELADSGLSDELDRRLPGATWRVEVVETRLVKPPATDAAIVNAARRLLLDRGWDVVVCLTDLPLHVHRRPVVAHANPVQNVAIVSVPAFGVVGARQRIREPIVRLLERLIGSHGHSADSHGVRGTPRRLSIQRVRELGTDTASGAFAFTARVLTGNLVLLSGMVAANQPWKLSLRLSRALTGAVAVGVIGLVTSDVWRLSDAYGWWRLAGTALLSIGATAATLIVGADLWEHDAAAAVRKQVLLFNIATVCTVAIGVAALYAVLYLLALLAAFWFVVPQVFTNAVSHPPSLRDYVDLAWFTCSLAMIGGALGAALETEDAVRDAAYVRRSDAQTEKDETAATPSRAAT